MCLWCGAGLSKRVEAQKRDIEALEARLVDMEELCQVVRDKGRQMDDFQRLKSALENRLVAFEARTTRLTEAGKDGGK